MLSASVAFITLWHSFLLPVPNAQCLVIGEITTDKMIVVLNKVDQLPAESGERAKQLDRVKARIAKVLSTTLFADAPMVSRCCLSD